MTASTTTRGPVARRRPLAALLAGAAALALAACGRNEPEPAKAPPPPKAETQVFSVLATTDLKDAQALEQMVEKATGVKLRFSWGGTMESTEAVLSGKTKADAAWFANAKYLLSDPQGQARVKLQEKIMLSPITVGVSESAAKKLGWDDPATAEKVTWKTIAKVASEGKLTYALSNPATSNQGFMALMGVVAAASDKADALAAADVDRGAIASFLKGYKLVGDNSTYLAEKFIEGQGPRLNAFINYESWLLSLNNGGKLKEKLVLVYPKEGVSTADYPFMLLQDARRADYQKVVAYLKGSEAQTWLARQTLRRPISGEVAAQVADLFPKAGGTLVELAFSPDRQLSDGLIDAYLNEFRRPIASTFVLDTSGSMEGGGRRAQLVQAIHYIAGDDASLTGRLAKLTDRERVWMLPFSDRPRQMTYFELPARPLQGARRADPGGLGGQAAGARRRARLRRPALDVGRDRALRQRAGGAPAHAGRAEEEPRLPVLGRRLHRRREQPGPQPGRLPGRLRPAAGRRARHPGVHGPVRRGQGGRPQGDGADHRRQGVRRPQDAALRGLQGHPRLPVRFAHVREAVPDPPQPGQLARDDGRHRRAGAEGRSAWSASPACRWRCSAMPPASSPAVCGSAFPSCRARPGTATRSSSATTATPARRWAGRSQAVRGLVQFNPENRLPASLQAKVLELCTSLERLLSQWERSKGALSLQEGFHARHIAISYLPDALKTYLSIPAQYASSRVIKDGKTAVDIFRGTLVDLEGKVAQLADDLASQDAHAFLAHSQFLHDKFGATGVLPAPALTPPKAQESTPHGHS